MKKTTKDFIKSKGYKKTVGSIDKFYIDHLAAEYRKKGTPATITRDKRDKITIYWLWIKE